MLMDLKEGAAPLLKAAAEPLGAALVEGRGLTLRFGGKTVLDKVSIAIGPSEIVTLIGPNGAGKTSLVRVLLGLVAPDEGAVERAPGLRVGYVPQRFPIESILPLSVRRFMNLNARVSQQKMEECLAETGAASLIDAQLIHLSGGEFQRVLLARALARNPQLLVLDEPAQAVDFMGAAALYELIIRIRDRRGCGVLLVSHDLHVVIAASDRVICLNRHICCEGVPETVKSHPEYRRLFGSGASANLGLYRHHHDHSHTLSGEPTRGH